MIGGIITLLALLGFLAVVVYIFIIKGREDFDEQARQPLDDRDESSSDHHDDAGGEKQQ